MSPLKGLQLCASVCVSFVTSGTVWDCVVRKNQSFPVLVCSDCPLFFSFSQKSTECLPHVANIWSGVKKSTKSRLFKKKKKHVRRICGKKKRNCWVEIEILKVCASTNTLKLPTTAAHAWNGISSRLIIDIDENMDKSSNLCNILSLKRIKGQCKIDWNKTRILSQIYPQSCTDELISWSSWLRQMSTVKKSAKYLKSAQDFIT